jgi:hypothetical protein
MREYLNETCDRFIKRHQFICEYYNIKKSADELDLHHKNLLGGRLRTESNVSLRSVMVPPTMSIAGHQE